MEGRTYLDRPTRVNKGGDLPCSVPMLLPFARCLLAIEEQRSCGEAQTTERA